MTQAAKPVVRPAATKLPFALADLPLWIGLSVMAISTVRTLGEQVWSKEWGAHGPIVLAVGGWLIFEKFAGARPFVKPGSLVLTWAGLILSLAVYTFGRAFDFISLETAGVYGTGVSMFYSRIGLRSLLHMWFPVGYLSFLIPPPQWLIDQLTGPLKQFVSWAAMSVLSFAGIPVAREGVTIYVSAYRLLVEDACSGMNSLVGLVAVSLIYIYLLRGSNLRYATLLLIAIIPIAVLGNILRIMTLILLTYYFGDEVAQGFLHQTAGLFLFAVDLILVFALDKALWQIVPASWRRA